MIPLKTESKANQQNSQEYNYSIIKDQIIRSKELFGRKKTIEMLSQDIAFSKDFLEIIRTIKTEIIGNFKTVRLIDDIANTSANKAISKVKSSKDVYKKAFQSFKKDYERSFPEDGATAIAMKSIIDELKFNNKLTAPVLMNYHNKFYDDRNNKSVESKIFCKGLSRLSEILNYKEQVLDYNTKDLEVVPPYIQFLAIEARKVKGSYKQRVESFKHFLEDENNFEKPLEISKSLINNTYTKGPLSWFMSSDKKVVIGAAQTIFF